MGRRLFAASAVGSFVATAGLLDPTFAAVAGWDAPTALGPELIAANPDEKYLRHGIPPAGWLLFSFPWLVVPIGFRVAQFLPAIGIFFRLLEPLYSAANRYYPMDTFLLGFGIVFFTYAISPTVTFLIVLVAAAFGATYYFEMLSGLLDG